MNQISDRVGRGMAKGAAWMVAMRLCIRGIGLASTVILARLLVPEDFGLVALATMFYGLLDVLGEFSFDLALIQNQGATRSDYDTAWTLSIIRGVILALLLILMAHPAARFFGKHEIESIIYFLALSAFIQGFQNIGIVDFRKQLWFGRDFQFSIYRKMIAFGVTVSLAIVFRNYWALVGGIVMANVGATLLSYKMHPYRPRLCLSSWRTLIGFSKWLLANNLFIFVNQRADMFLIGKMVGAQAAGVYSIALEISNLATTELVWPITRAIFPGYAKLSHDPSRLRAAYLDVLALALLVGLPIAVGTATVADLIVRISLGEKWLSAISLIQILALYGGIRVAYANSAAVLMATNRPHLLTYILLGSSVTLVALLPAAVYVAGAIGAAWTLVGWSLVWMLCNLVLMGRLLDIALKELLARFWRPTVACAVMAGAVYFCRLVWSKTWHASSLPGELGFAVSVGVVTYVGLVLLTWRMSRSPSGAEGQILGYLSRRLKSRPSRTAGSNRHSGF